MCKRILIIGIIGLALCSVAYADGINLDTGAYIHHRDDDDSLDLNVDRHKSGGDRNLGQHETHDDPVYRLNIDTGKYERNWGGGRTWNPDPDDDD